MRFDFEITLIYLSFRTIVINNAYVNTIDEIPFERPNYGKFLENSHSAEDILQKQTGLKPFIFNSRPCDVGKARANG